MLDNELIKHAASDLQSIDSKEVVKVAGILRRMRNWFKSFMSGEYAGQIDELRSESKEMAAYVASMGKSLKELDESIKDLDVGSYHANLLQVRSLIPGFIDKLSKLNETVQEADDKIPPDIKQTATLDEPKEQIAPEPPQPINPQPQRAAPVGWQRYDESKSVSEVGSFSDVVIRDTPLTNTKRGIKNALENLQWPTKDINALLRGDDRNPLLSQFKQAILGGTVLAIKPATPGKEQRRERPETDFHYLIQTDPFVIPGTNIILKTNVIVHDHAVDDLRNLNLVQVVNNRFDTEEVSAPVTPASEQVVAPALEDEVVENIDEADDGEEAPLFRHASLKARKKSLKKIALTQPQRGVRGAIQLPRRFNKVGAVPFAKAAREAYQEVFGEDPTMQTLGLIWAQAAMESGQQFNLMNNNVGYVKATDKWLKPGRMYTVVDSAKELSDVGEEMPHKGAKFRAFATPKDGVKDYLKVLQANWPDSLKWKAAGLAVCDAAYLSENAYYTAPMKTYAKGMDGLFDTFMSKVATQLSPPLKNAPTPPPGKCPVLRTTRAKVGTQLKGGRLNEPLAWPTKSLKHAWRGSLDVNPEANVPKMAPGSPIAPKQINPSEEFMSAMRIFVAEDSMVTKLVRRSLEKKLLPTTQILIKVNSDNTIVKGKQINNTPALAEFSHILSSALREEIEAKTAVHSNGKDFEIVCHATGSALAVGNAVQEIGNYVAKAFVSSINKALTKKGRDMSVAAISVSSHLDKESSLPLFEMEDALKNHRLFSFAVVN